MGLDSHLVTAIKKNFARKSSAQLQEIVQSDDCDRWSPEAVAAAGEVLQARKDGQAQEPLEAEEEEEPPPYHYEPEELALGVLAGLLTGYLIIPYYKRTQVDHDLPVPFGPKTAWLALATKDTKAVATALDLRRARDATWAEGIEAACRGKVFVTPPLADWTLVVGTALFPPDRTDAFLKPLLERLSLQFKDAQYFCTLQPIELHVWARAQKGQLVRGYGWLGEKVLTLWDEGVPTKSERYLGLRLKDGRSPTGTVADENAVLQLASLWSIDPSSLSEEYKEQVMGIRGSLTSVEGRTSR